MICNFPTSSTGGTKSFFSLVDDTFFGDISLDANDGDLCSSDCSPENDDERSKLFLVSFQEDSQSGPQTSMISARKELALLGTVVLAGS